MTDAWLEEQWEKRLGAKPFRLGQVKELIDECAKFGRHAFDPLADRCVRCGAKRDRQEDQQTSTGEKP